MMRYSVIAVLTVALNIFVPARAADTVEWGPITNGLKMSVAVSPEVPGHELRLRITLENVSERSVVVQLGMTNSVQEYISALVLHLGTRDRHEHERTFTLMPRIMVITGYLGPLTIQLRPGSSY